MTTMFENENQKYCNKIFFINTLLMFTAGLIKL